MNKNNNLKDQPYLPVNLFKEQDLMSIKKNQIFKILNSSYTNNNLSKIYLDKLNSQNQVKALNEIMSEILGKERLPMLIVDCRNISENRFKFNAKTCN